MFRGLPQKKPSPPARIKAPDSEKKPLENASSDGKCPAVGAAPFSASPYKKLPGTHASWIKMDLSLLPKEIAEELGTDFDSLDPATTGEARTLPEKLRPILVDADQAENDDGLLVDQTSGLISQLLAANWESAPESLKRDIKKFLGGEISRSLAITKSIAGGIVPEKERVRLRTPDHTADTMESHGYPTVLQDLGGGAVWGDKKDLDQLIS